MDKMEKMEVDALEYEPNREYSELEFEHLCNRKIAAMPFIEALEHSLLDLNQLYRRRRSELMAEERRAFKSVLMSIESTIEFYKEREEL